MICDVTAFSAASTLKRLPSRGCADKKSEPTPQIAQKGSENEMRGVHEEHRPLPRCRFCQSGFHHFLGLFIALLGSAFHHLTVEDKGERLLVRFGSIPLFRRTLRYADIEKAEVGRTLLLDGWGIHLSIRGGWVWNLWGRDCVVVHSKKGGTLRIGTDGAENLDRFLERRVGPSGHTDAYNVSP